MSETLKQKRRRKLKKITRRNKARAGKDVIFTDHAGDAEKKKERINNTILHKPERNMRVPWSWY